MPAGINAMRTHDSSKKEPPTSMLRIVVYEAQWCTVSRKRIEMNGNVLVGEQCICNDFNFLFKLDPT